MKGALVCVALSLFGFGCSGGERGTQGSSGGGSSGHSGSGGSSATGGGDSGGSSASGGAPPLTCSGGSAGAPKGFHVATNGSATGDGSAANPWDLATALLTPPGVKPGDTIYLHAGTYTGHFVVKLDGQDGAPITVRSYPGEWAVIDGAGTTAPTLEVYHQWTVFRDFEVTNSDPTRFTSAGRPSGIYVEGPHMAFVNLIVHDTGTGIICNSADDTHPEYSPEMIVYGCILYNNGWEDVDRGHGHHLYLQNRDGTKHILDNVLFDAFGFGIHAYSDNDTHWAQGYEIAGNVWFQNGAAQSGDSKLYDDCMVGHNGTHPVARLTLHDNYGWAKGPSERDLRLGWSAPNDDATLENNFIVGQTIFQPSWQSVTMTGNTFYGDVQGVDPASYPDNTYLGAKPSGTTVVVRPNAWEPGRAHVIVYNWDAVDSVTVDPGNLFPKGAKYELRNAEDPLAAPLLSGTWDGTPFSVPMTALGVAQPIGTPDAIVDNEKTGKDFAVFLLTGACD